MLRVATGLPESTDLDPAPPSHPFMLVGCIKAVKLLVPILRDKGVKSWVGLSGPMTVIPTGNLYQLGRFCWHLSRGGKSVFLFSWRLAMCTTKVQMLIGKHDARVCDILQG